MKQIVFQFDDKDYKISYEADFSTGSGNQAYNYNVIVEDKCLLQYMDRNIQFSLSPAGRCKNGTIAYRPGGQHILTNINEVKNNIVNRLIHAEWKNIHSRKA